MPTKVNPTPVPKIKYKIATNDPEEQKENLDLATVNEVKKIHLGCYCFE